MEEHTDNSEIKYKDPHEETPLERFGHPLTVIFMCVCIAFGLQMLISPLFSAVFDGIFGTSLLSDTVNNRLNSQTSQVLMKVVIISTQTISFGGTAFLFAGMAKDNYRILQLKPIKRPMLLLISGLIALAALPVIPLLMIPKDWVVLPEALKPLEDFLLKQEADTAKYLEKLLKNHLALNVFFIAVTPAIMEELFFRGLIMGVFRKFTNIHVAIWVTGILFSLLHLQILGFFPRMALGIVFGYLCYWSGSLFPCIIAHFVNNAMSAFAYYAQNSADTEILHPEYQPPFWIGMIALPILGGLLYVFYLNSKN